MKWLISTRNVSILNIAKRCNVFHVFFLGDLQMGVSQNMVTLPQITFCSCRKWMLFESLMLRQTRPNKSYHIIPHLFPLLWFWLWKHISKIQSQKRYKKHIQSWTKTLPDLLPGLGGGPRNFQRQGSRQFEIRCIYRGGWNSTQLYKDYNST